MSYLVVGGAGFIGLNLIEELLSRSERVVALDRARIPNSAVAFFSKLPGALTAIQADVSNYDEVYKVIKENKIEKIFYGAAVTAAPSRERNYPETIFEANTIGLLNVFKGAAQSCSVARIINISSGSAYGDGGFGDTGWTEPLDEYATREDPKSLYAISKLAGEKIALRMGELENLRVVNVRLSAIFGPWEYDTGVRDTLSAPLQATLIALNGANAVLSRREARDWTYSRHVAKALCALMVHKEPRSSLYNITSGKTWSVLDWCGLLAVTFPDFKFRLAEVGETPNVDLFGDRDRIRMSPDRFLRDIGYTLSFNIEEIYEDFEKWLQHVGKLWEYS